MKSRKTIIALSLVIAMLAIFSVMILKTTNAQSSGLDPELSARLNEILSNQRLIMADLSAMKEQLKILTIRVTQQQ